MRGYSLRRSSATTLLSLSAIRSLKTSDLPAHAQKLLSFTDNRQDASLQAGHRIRDLLLHLTTAQVASSPGGGSRDEHLQALLDRCESDLERDWLRHVARCGMRLPDDAQVYLDACQTRPDFVYTSGGVYAAIYIDGSHHDHPPSNATCVWASRSSTVTRSRSSRPTSSSRSGGAMTFCGLPRISSSSMRRTLSLTRRIDEAVNTSTMYNPIMFCRFIPTVDYLTEALRNATRGVEIAGVTGTLPPAEREERVSKLATHDKRVLVCTDCLSEGINLQQGFDAVVHYDLSWNPTRHEQREGRVDRYGQPNDRIKVVTYYGIDNQIDGIVLDVLLRKHKTIRNSLGVSVPVPGNNEDVVEALQIADGDLIRAAIEFTHAQRGDAERILHTVAVMLMLLDKARLAEMHIAPGHPTDQRELASAHVLGFGFADAEVLRQSVGYLPAIERLTIAEQVQQGEQEIVL